MALPKVADRYTAQRPKQDNLYSDFLTNLNVHPDNGQVITNKNEEAVISSIKNLLFTNKYERLFQPDIGSNIQKLLFEPMSPQTEVGIASQVRETIENYEPRAKLIDVVASAYPDNNAYMITVSFYITSIEDVTTINIPLYRVR